MTTSNKTLLCLVLFALTAACSPSAEHPTAAASPASVTTVSSGTLDGRVFTVEGRDLPPGLPTTIELSFASGLLDSSACRAQGLPPIAYTLRDDGTFYAERRTPKALDKWTGRVRGNEIEGLYTSEQGGTITMRIPFKGQAQASR